MAALGFSRTETGANFFQWCSGLINVFSKTSLESASKVEEPRGPTCEEKGSDSAGEIQPCSQGMSTVLLWEQAGEDGAVFLQEEMCAWAWRSQCGS